MVRALESVADSRFIQSAKWMGGSKVRSSRGMAGFILVVLCIAGYVPQYKHSMLLIWQK